MSRPRFSRHLGVVHYGNDGGGYERKRYTDEFKSEAAKQVIEYGPSVRDVSGRLGISIDSMHAWVRHQRRSPQAQQADNASSAEMRRLQTDHRFQSRAT